MQSLTNIYNELCQLFDLSGDNVEIVEKQINTETHTEYIEYSKNHKNSCTEKEIINRKDKIFDTNLPKCEKKKLLKQLASINNIEAFRTIEKYLNQPNIQLYDWAYLALQESRMMIESNLLEEFKVLISSGLGGKGLKLRYFFVFIAEQGNKFSDIQKEILFKEVDFQIRKCGGEMEDQWTDEHLASFVGIIPITVDLNVVFKEVIKECNDLGKFLMDEFIVTNVKVLDTEEISEIIAINNLL